MTVQANVERLVQGNMFFDVVNKQMSYIALKTTTDNQLCLLLKEEKNVWFINFASKIDVKRFIDSLNKNIDIIWTNDDSIHAFLKKEEDDD